MGKRGLTKEGVAVVSKDGKLVTVWGSDNFDNNMVEIIKSNLEIDV